MQSRTFLFLLGAVAVIILLVTAPDDGTARRSVLGLGLGLATALALWKPPSPKTFWYTIAGAALLSLALHVPFRLSYPATNDEGSILMDIHNVRSGVWPFRDVGGAKGPLGLLLLAPVVFATGNSLAAARVTVSLFTALEVVLLGVLGSRLWGARAGMLAALLAAATPAMLAQTTQVFLQPFALPFATLALILLTPREKTPAAASSSSLPAPQFHFTRPALAGALFALAFLARPTVMAFAPIGILLPFFQDRRPWHTRVTDAFAVVGGLLVTVGVAALLMLPFLGPEKTLDALGRQGVQVGQQRATRGQAAAGFSILTGASAGDPARILQNAQPLLRGALSLVLLTAALLVNRVMNLARLPRFVAAAALAVGAVALPSVLATLDITPEYATVRPLLFGSSTALLALTSIIALRRPRPDGKPARDLLLLGGTWLALAVGYANYGRFRGHYHAEFLPLYILAASAFLAEAFPPGGTNDRGNAALWWRGVPHQALFGLAAMTLTLSFPIMLSHPHAGNIPLDVASEVAKELRTRTAPGDEIFTAQVLFPFLADRFVPFGIAHPGWYREEAVGILPTSVRALYYPDRDTLRKYVEEHPVRVIVIERRTREVYLEFDPALKALIEQRYTLARTFQNPLVDSIEIWQRAAE